MANRKQVQKDVVANPESSSSASFAKLRRSLRIKKQTANDNSNEVRVQVGGKKKRKNVSPHASLHPMGQVEMEGRSKVKKASIKDLPSEAKTQASSESAESTASPVIDVHFACKARYLQLQCEIQYLKLRFNEFKANCKCNSTYNQRKN